MVSYSNKVNKNKINSNYYVRIGYGWIDSSVAAGVLNLNHCSAPYELHHQQKHTKRFRTKVKASSENNKLLSDFNNPRYSTKVQPFSNRMQIYAKTSQKLFQGLLIGQTHNKSNQL